MPESPIVSEIAAAFFPYLKPSDELHFIRTQIAEYINTLRPQVSTENTLSERFSIPHHVTGIRRQYLTALHNGLKINQEYDQFRNQLQSQVTQATDENDSILDFKTHLELLRLRKLYQRYQILTHYFSEAEALATKSHIFVAPTVRQPSQLSSNEANQAELSLSLARLKELDRNLDIAILQANHQLKNEKQLLQETKSRGDVADTPSSETRVNALMAVNTELTNWIGESLAKCDGGNETHPPAREPSPPAEHDSTDYDKAIKQQYEKYLEARRRLLNAAAALSSSQPTSEETFPEPSPPAESTQMQPTENQPPNLSSTSPLPKITMNRLPQESHQQNLTNAHSRLENLLQAHKHSLREQLLRLGDESHLLPSYPILAKPQKGEQELDDIERLLKGWAFATEAAKTAASATVERQIDNGQKAVDETHEVLDGVIESEKMWKKFMEK